jgi:hypothetical protein
VRCVFKNTKRGSVSVTKTEGGSSNLQRDWTFQLTGSGIQPITESTAGGNNPVVFDDLKPGTYTLCEVGMPAGWHSSLGADGCVEITIDPGEDEAITIDNVRPDIELEKEVRRTPGGTFAKTALAHVGDTVQYRFTVTNAGVGELSVVLAEVATDRCDAGTMSGPTGDSDSDGKLDVSETWVYLCTHEITAGDPDPLPNTAKATGTDKFGNTDEDESSASVDVIHPDIEVDKELRRGDSGEFVDGPIQVHVGDTIQYRFAVTNEGDTPLAVEFSDPRCDAGTLTGPTGDADGDGKLDLAETWVYRCSHVVTAQSGDPVKNTVTVTGTDELGGKDEDTDSTEAEVVNLGIAVDKKLRRAEQGPFVEGPITVHVGDTIQYRFDVTNTGEAPLAVEFSDPRCDDGTVTGPEGDEDGDDRLDLDETWRYECTHLVTPESGDPIPNTVTVTGTDDLGGEVEDSDDETADVIHPEIEIDKQVDKQTVHVGDTLNYTFVVTNDGDTPLTVEFSDPRCDAGTLTGPTGDADGDQRLDIDETWTYECSHVVTDGDPNPLPNTAKVTGTDELGGEDSDEDTESVDIIKPNTLVVKEGNVFAYPGDTVTFSFAVTNNGNTPLTDVVVTDDRCAPVTRVSGDDVLDPGETWMYACSKQIPAGHKIGDENPIRNVATASGKDQLGKTVTSTDDHLVRVLHPAIDIEKTGPATAIAGDALQYTLTVTNPGDVSFAAQEVVVTDPRCEAPPSGPGTNGDATPGQLDPGDAWTYICTAQTVGQPAGTFVNTAIVTARDFNGRTVSDTDDFPTLLSAQGVLPSPEIVSGRARLRGPSGCVQGPFTATVRGRQIARVTFYRDGKKIKTINARRGQRLFKVRITPGGDEGTIHRVTARVRFRARSGTRARTLRLSYQRCRRQVIQPRFTG